MKRIKISLIGGSGFVGTRLLGLLKELPDMDLLNIDKNESLSYPEITSIANVLDVDAMTELLKGTDWVVLLAAEHRDDVSPVSLYYDVNVKGAENTLVAMERNGIKRLIFTSSVAVYGLDKENPSEKNPVDPFNDYGKSKWQAECVLQAWSLNHPDWNIRIIRPTVLFGEGNRGNVYNLLRQIASGRFIMIGKGENKKSMSYVGNIVAFILFLIENQKDAEGCDVFNYVDKPDLTTRNLVALASRVLNKRIPMLPVPYCLGMLGGYCFDILGKITGKKMVISSVRVRKFCAVTQFDASKAAALGFKPAYTLEEGLDRTLQYEFGKMRGTKLSV
ncbi:MAG: NAD-dependent epimerase/dehydratase family protein [Dysgonamonadaceae bacterium]|jgi:nucleoside-diphosphate-sugar epimerase|nr:NAD-dependent epimerase/dehydratase family protein [Dysgonamonadaceae bacterium]